MARPVFPKENSASSVWDKYWEKLLEDDEIYIPQFRQKKKISVFIFYNLLSLSLKAPFLSRPGWSDNLNFPIKSN
jgi:hypothetical protein